MAPAVHNRIRHHFKESVDPGLTTPELPVFRNRSNVDVSRKPTPRRKRSWKAFAGLVTAGLVLVAGAMTVSWRAHPSHAAVASPEQSLRSVTVARPAPAADASVVLPATIRPWQTTTLYARVSGYLKTWHSDLGTPVKAGELLAEIETPELDQELAEAR